MSAGSGVSPGSKTGAAAETVQKRQKQYMKKWHNKKMNMWRACNLTAFIHSSTGPVIHPFASRHEGPGFNPQGGTYLKPRFSC
jgi:hypothetical protein